MYSIGSSARKGFAGSPTYDDEFSFDNRAGFGVIPAIAISGGISLLSGLFGSHSGKTTHAQRFLDAQAAGDTATAHALIDQAYYHAYVQNIPDKADWLKVWQVMLDEATPANRAYMNQKMGLTTNTPAAGGGGVPGSPNQPGATGYVQPNLSGITSVIFSPIGLGLAAAIFFLTRKR